MKIGFIDYYLDEWHANNYPELIAKASGGAHQVCCAFAYSEPPAEMNLRSNAQWSADYGVELVSSIEEVIERSDCLVVLSPDNPEMHEILCQLPLASGKRTYIDKTFAPDKATAERIFANAEAHNTPCFSSSALRFASELDEIDLSSIYKIYSEGPSSLSVYAIHQIEPIVRLMNCRAKRVMFLGDERHPSYMVQFEDGRLVQMHHRDDKGRTFRITTVTEDNKAVHHEIKSNFFGLFIQSMIRFFETGEAPVTHAQTIDVIAIRAAAIEACGTPFRWIEL